MKRGHSSWNASFMWKEAQNRVGFKEISHSNLMARDAYIICINYRQSHAPNTLTWAFGIKVVVPMLFSLIFNFEIYTFSLSLCVFRFFLFFSFMRCYFFVNRVHNAQCTYACVWRLNVENVFFKEESQWTVSLVHSLHCCIYFVTANYLIVRLTSFDWNFCAILRLKRAFNWIPMFANGVAASAATFVRRLYVCCEDGLFLIHSIEWK